MGFRDWKVREVLSVTAGVLAGSAFAYAGTWLTGAVLALFGLASPLHCGPDYFFLITVFPAGFFVGCALSVQLWARRVPKGVVHAAVVGLALVCGAAVITGVVLSIHNEILAMLAGGALTAPGLGVFGWLFASWVKRNRWTAARMQLVGQETPGGWDSWGGGGE